MASQQESKIPGLSGGGAVREKRRSFLPAPQRTSVIAAPISSFTSNSTALAAEVPTQLLKPFSALKQSTTLNEPPLAEAVVQPQKSFAFLRQNVAPPRESLLADDLTQLPRPSSISKQTSPQREPSQTRLQIPGAENLIIDSRVLISGVKPGILRYVGSTHIAPGFWCGVELFDASGLHDGEVDGKRYFTCKPFRGIFAPLDKVLPDPKEQALESSVNTELRHASTKAAGHLKYTFAGTHDPEVAESALSETSVLSAVGDKNKPLGSSRPQIARFSGIPKPGATRSERTTVKTQSFENLQQEDVNNVSRLPSKSASASTVSKIASYSKREKSVANVQKPEDDGSLAAVNSTIIRGEERMSDDFDGEKAMTISPHVEKQLHSDSRQYLNITFSKDTPANNLPDVVSSASSSPSPPSREKVLRGIPSVLNKTQSAQEIARSLAADISLGLMDPDIILDDTKLLEGTGADKVVSSASESDISQNSSTLEETSTVSENEVGEVLSSTPLPGGLPRKFAAEMLSDMLESPCGTAESTAEKVEAPHAKRALQEALIVSQGNSPVRKRKDSDAASSSSSGASAAMDHLSHARQDLLQEESSNGISPEVSQILEWDYDHDAFDAKLLEKNQDGMSTSTSDSCSETSADPGGALADKGITDVEMTVNEMGEVNQFDEDIDNDFENIDEFPLGLTRDEKHMMTDSGISEKDFGDHTTEALAKRSVEFDNRASVIPLSETTVCVTVVDTTADETLQRDLMNGHSRQERPLSLISTTSADTGYVPDTDSEAGTLTTNSPTDWAEKHSHLLGHVTSGSLDVRQKTGASLGKARPVVSDKRISVQKSLETDSDIISDVTLTETETEGLVSDVELDKTATGQESGEEEVEDDESEELDSSSSEDEADDRPEDDRIEADRAMMTIFNGRREATFTLDSTASVSSTDGQAGGDMTESAEPVVVEDISQSEPRGLDVTIVTIRVEDGSGEVMRAPEPLEEQVARDQEESSAGRGLIGHWGSGEGDHADSSNPVQEVKDEAATPAKKPSVEHRKVNVKSVPSRLADYIKAPLPTKPREEKKAENSISKKNNNNATNVSKSNKTPGKKRSDTSPSTDKAKVEGNASLMAEEIEKKQAPPPPIKEEKPKVKRTMPKSKWGNIMSQIEANKDTTKPKPKTEVKSSIAAYLTSPLPSAPKRDNSETCKSEKPNKEDLPKPKVKVQKYAKLDFSNVKSKLMIATTPKTSPRESSSSPGPGTPLGSNAPTRMASPRKPSAKTSSEKVQVDYTQTTAQENWSMASSAGSSRTDLSVCEAAGSVTPCPRPPDGDTKHMASPRKPSAKTSSEKVQVDYTQTTAQENWSILGNSVSRVGARNRNGERRHSVGSSKSDFSAAQRSVKAMNLKNAQKLDTHVVSSSHNKKSAIKSSIPPAAFRKTQNKAEPSAKPPDGAPPGLSTSAKCTPPRIFKAGAATSQTSSKPANQSRTRTKTANTSQLKSGHPPDVVSTSARGTRAQEVARLESLCETRTKELNYTKMKLKAGLQAFDAMTCLVNYCTNQLDAFSCPQVKLNLKTAEGKLTEKQSQIECLQQQNNTLEEQLAEMTRAKDIALEEVNKLKQEMKEAEDVHIAAMQQLTDKHITDLKTQEDELKSQHQQIMQQMQKFQEKQVEHIHQIHKREVSELNAEHQMATNQLRVVHLEEIQELRNKHDKQMEELHEQHRSKLEDITRRFESIKQSLSEKVTSLCQECEDLRFRARSSEEALQRDADAKVQFALAPYLNLPNEIESLKTVIDIRTEEIQKLRRQNMDLVKQLEELPIAQEKVVSLQQKVENLQAIINIKTDHEKQLHEKCQVLMRKYDRESRANKRLSMDYEQAMWRMSQSADFSSGSVDSVFLRQLSHSPTRSTSDYLQSHGSHSPLRPGQHNIPAMPHAEHNQPNSGHVTRRPRRTSGGDEHYDRKIRCRSATFVMEKSKVLQHKTEHGQEEGDGTWSLPAHKSQVNKPTDWGAKIGIDSAKKYLDFPGFDNGQLELENSAVVEVSDVSDLHSTWIDHNNGDSSEQYLVELIDGNKDYDDTVVPLATNECVNDNCCISDALVVLSPAALNE